MTMKISTRPEYLRASREVSRATALAIQRHRKGVSLAYLAGGLHISATQLQGIARGDRGTSLSTIFDLAAALGVSPAVFFPRGTP
jgi:transcriptional regulator with XRE-family HTH domain